MPAVLRTVTHAVLPALLLAMSIAGSAHAGEPAQATLPEHLLTDGPHVFRDATGLHARWLCAGKVVAQEARPGEHGSALLPAVCGYPRPLRLLPPAAASSAVLPMPSRVAALSDIHGQFGLLRRLLRAHGIIDQDERWSFGDGALVVGGDVFDRGPQVTEALWLLYGLQQQAAAAGGAVHVVLGNHEAMVLYGDLRYVNPKYLETATRLGRPYPALFGPDSVLGQWLRTRPQMLRLGDTLFLHGGIAPENLDLALAIDATNAAYDGSLGLPKAQLKADPATARLYDGKRSPIWYRGYFNGELDTAAVGALVGKLGLQRIVVGHTTIGEVASFHDGRIIAIDSAIKRGKSGQLLFIETGKLSRGLLDGSRQPLPAMQEGPDDPD